MCGNIKVNFADPLQYRRGPPGAADPRLKTPALMNISEYKNNIKLSIRSSFQNTLMNLYFYILIEYII